MTIHEKLYRCRKAAGKSQEELAEIIGVSRQSISKWETGDAAPEIGKLLPLAQCFGVTTDWLLDDRKAFPFVPPTAPQTVGAAPPKTNKLFGKYGWIIGLVMSVYGVLLLAGMIPFTVGILSFADSMQESGATALSRALLVPPVVMGTVAIALLAGGVVVIVRHRKKYPRQKRPAEKQDRP